MIFKMIEIKDFFDEIKEENYREYKVHFAIGGKGRKNDAPLNVFVMNGFKEWQEYQTKQNFERDYVFSLIYYKKNEWMFAGIYESITSIEMKDHFQYETKLLDLHEDLTGRLIISYKKPFRNSYPNLETVYKDLRFVEILRDKAKIEEFPGYEKVNISFSKLKYIVEQKESSWKTALSNIYGIYLISDNSNGKLYVGAAYGEKSF